MHSYEFTLFADHFQFYLQDDAQGKGDLSEAWNEATTDRLLAVAPFVIGVGTVRNMDVLVSVTIHPSPPIINEPEFDHITLASLCVETGRIVVAGCTDYFPDAPRIDLPPGTYQAIVCYKNLDSLSEDGLDGDDSYHIHLFPGQEITASVIKQRNS